MSTIQLQLPFDSFLDGLSDLNSSQLDDLLRRIVAIKARQRMPKGDQLEATLLEVINATLTETQKARFDLLDEKRQALSLTPDELSEFRVLADCMEEIQEKRLEALIELAVLRKLSLNEVMEQLGLRTR